MKENKQYKLKRWYPSLHPEWKDEEITVEKTKDGNYVNFMDCQVVPKHEVENNPDFWEEVKQPLFVTDDGVAVFDKNQALWEVLPDFQRVVTVAEYVEKGNKTFNYESNADKYIEDHKPKTLFITEDGVNIDHPKENVFLVNEFFEKDEGWYNESVGGKVFFHESNADEYIWRNKPLFTFEEMKKANIDINWCTEDIYYKAKERIKE